MKLDLYECDICKKEHRRSDRIDVHFYKNKYSGSDAMFNDICSECEDALDKTITDRHKAKTTKGIAP